MKNSSSAPAVGKGSSAASNAGGTAGIKRAGTSVQFQTGSQQERHLQNELLQINEDVKDVNVISLQTKINYLENDLDRRQESYVSRERAYKVRIDELEEELTNQKQQKTGWMKSDAKISKLKAMQGQILNNVELVQDRTARIMQEQERDLLRAFRARLFDVQTELEKEKSKKDDGAAAWIEKSRQLESEVEWAKEVADRLERVNQSLLQENARLKSQFASQEEDRNFLIKQLVSVKKDNARLRAEYNEVEVENEELVKRAEAADAHIQSTMSSKNAGVGSKLADSEEKFKEVNVRLRRLLAEERKSLQQVRQNYANELKSRTELEMLLRNCVEDVRREIARRHVESSQYNNNNGSNDLAKLYSKTNNAANAGLRPVDQFTQEDRERALELLLSQERVVSLIYAKTFPINVNHNTSAPMKAAVNSSYDSTGAAAAMNGLLAGDDGAASRPGTSETKFPTLALSAAQASRR